MYIALAGYHWKHNSDFAIVRKDGYNGMQLLRFATNARILIGDTEYSVKPNTAILIDTNVPHSLFATENEYVDDWIRFQFAHGEREKFNQLDLPVNVPVDLGDDHFIELMIQSSCKVFENKYPSASEIEHNLLSSIILYLNGLDKNVRCIKHIPYEDKLKKLRDEIFANPGMQRTAVDIAKELNMSIGYLNKIYKGLFGTSYMKDVFSARMQYAQTLLAETDKSVYEIAELCGYNSSEHFSRSFKKYSCVSPLEFRKKF